MTLSPCASANANLALRHFARVAAKLRPAIAETLLAHFARPDLPPDVVTNTLRDGFPNPSRGVEGMHRRIGAHQADQSCEGQLKNAPARHRVPVCCGPVTHGARRWFTMLRCNSKDGAPLSFEGGCQVHVAQSRGRDVCADATPPWRVAGLETAAKGIALSLRGAANEHPVMGGDKTPTAAASRRLRLDGIVDCGVRLSPWHATVRVLPARSSRRRCHGQAVSV